MLKAVIDANVWVSALITAGTTRNLINRLKQAHFQLIWTDEILDELLTVVARKKLAQRILPQDRDDLVDLIRRHGLRVELKPPLPDICRDPKDDMYLATALVSDSDFLVTGDRDLLVLQSHGRTSIVAPADFLKALEQTSSL